MKIYFFGDSIFFGQFVSPHRTWVHRLSQMLEEQIGQRYQIATMVQNPSVNGDTTAQALERMAYDVEGHKPDYVVIQFGMNDCNYWLTDNGAPRVAPEAFIANLREIIQRVRSWGGSPLLQNNHPSGRNRDILPGAGMTYEESNRRYNQLVREVAALEQVPFLDIEQEAARFCKENGLTADDLLLPDKLHLGERGHEFYIRLCSGFLIDHIEKGIRSRSTQASGF